MSTTEALCAAGLPPETAELFKQMVAEDIEAAEIQGDRMVKSWGRGRWQGRRMTDERGQTMAMAEQVIPKDVYFNWLNEDRARGCEGVDPDRLAWARKHFPEMTVRHDPRLVSAGACGVRRVIVKRY